MSEGSKQLEIIISVLKKLGGKATLTQVTEGYCALTSSPVTFGKRIFVKGVLEENCSTSQKFKGKGLFVQSDEDKDIWSLVKKTNAKKPMSNPKTKPKALIEEADKFIDIKDSRALETRLFKRITRQFDKVKYIGDISIDDDEFEILKKYLAIRINGFISDCAADDPMLVVGLVQVGIKYYNGNYWTHIDKITGKKTDQFTRKIIGNRLYYTLEKHNKIRLDSNDIVNNILMHCFITEYYAADLFEFLFMYYTLDLDRDLQQHKNNKTLRDNLISSMKKSENTARSFRIRRGTADAVTANERGCKIRVTNILKMMDKYLFEDYLPENSKNRTTQMFAKWAKNSDRFKFDKQYISGLGPNGIKHYHRPYIKFDYKRECFMLVLPVQTVPLGDDEETASLSWKIKYSDKEELIYCETQNTVVGCKTLEIIYLELESTNIFNTFTIELIKNDTVIANKFAVHSGSIRFFDSDYDMINSKNLNSGTVYAFTLRTEHIEASVDFEEEKYLGLNMSCLQLENGDIVKSPDGKAISVGKDLEEGLSRNHLVDGAFCTDNNSEIFVYSKMPSILIRMRENSESGTLIVINDKKFKFDKNNCFSFKQDESDTIYYIFELDKYCKDNGVYRVIIDVPSDRRSRDYTFAYAENLEFEFNEKAYVFKENGIITFNENLKIASDDEYITASDNNSFSFAIDNELDYISFTVGNASRLDVCIEPPVFKWKSDESEAWQVEKPEELWHTDMPDFFYFMFPDKYMTLHTKNISLDEEDAQQIIVNKSSDLDIFVCDTRKIKSWYDIDNPFLRLYIDLYDEQYLFETVLTRDILVSFVLGNDSLKNELIIKNSVIGFANCVVDIYRGEMLVASKQTVTSNGAKIKVDDIAGDFEVIYFEEDDEEDEFDFGFDDEDFKYSEFARRSVHLENKHDLTDKIIRLKSISQRLQNSIFKAPLLDLSGCRVYITDLLRDDTNDNSLTYKGTCTKGEAYEADDYAVEVKFPNKEDMTKCHIKYYDYAKRKYLNFIYDSELKKIIRQSDCTREDLKKIRFKLLSDSHYFNIDTEKAGE